MSSLLFERQTLSFKQQVLGAGVLILGTLLSTIIWAPPSTAVQLPNGQTAFNSPPRLVDTSSSFSAANSPSTYYFTLEVPVNAGEPLKAVQIVQLENVETISFKGKATQAFRRDKLTGKTEIPLAAVGGPAQPGDITVVFDQPVQPGNQVTVAVKARANPSYSGIYQFGITAYPAGEDGIGQFLGFGRIHFND